MSKIKNFNRFSKVYESEIEGSQSTEEIIDVAKKEMPLQDVLDEVEAEVDNNNSDISSKMKDNFENIAQGQVEPEGAEEIPQSFEESITNEEVDFSKEKEKSLTNPEVLDELSQKSLVNFEPLVPNMKALFRGQEVNIPAGSNFIASEWVGDYIIYKDKNGKFKNVSIKCTPTEEEIAHIKSIFEKLGKKSSWLKFADKFLQVGAYSAMGIGFALAIYGMIKWQMESPDKWLSTGGAGEGSRAGFDWSIVAPRGGEEFATGASMLGGGIVGALLIDSITNKREAIEKGIRTLTKVIKARLMPLGMSVTELKTAADVGAVFNTSLEEEIAKTEAELMKLKQMKGSAEGNVRESKSFKFGYMKKF